MTEMAQALDISKQQAWQLLQSLTYSGELERGTRTVVVEDARRGQHTQHARRSGGLVAELPRQASPERHLAAPWGWGSPPR